MIARLDPKNEETAMNVLNMYFSSTGNTEKVAKKIEETVGEAGHRVNTLKITKDMDVDVLHYDLVFVGSGVYEWLPGKSVMQLFGKLRHRYVDSGDIKPGSPRRPDTKVVVYCTYGGAHTGANEAIPAVKYMAQLFDHLGFEIVAEWYIVGEYRPDKFQEFSTTGRLGDIRGRPNEEDLRHLAERVRGILRT